MQQHSWNCFLQFTFQLILFSTFLVTKQQATHSIWFKQNLFKFLQQVSLRPNPAYRKLHKSLLVLFTLHHGNCPVTMLALFHALSLPQHIQRLVNFLHSLGNQMCLCLECSSYHFLRHPLDKISCENTFLNSSAQGHWYRFPGILFLLPLQW